MAILLNELTREPALPLREGQLSSTQGKKDVTVICSEVTSLHFTLYVSIITSLKIATDMGDGESLWMHMDCSNEKQD